MLPGLPAPVLVAVDKIGEVADQPELHGQMKNILAKNQNDGTLLGLINYLKTQFKEVTGSEKLISEWCFDSLNKRPVCTGRFVLG